MGTHSQKLTKEKDGIDAVVSGVPDGMSVYYGKKKKRSCRQCGCTDEDCRGCIKRTGAPCSWIAPDLCSACQEVRT